MKFVSMRFGFVVICVLVGSFLLSGCDNEKDPYSGLSGLVAERNAARENISHETALKKSLEKETGDNGSKKESTTDDLSQPEEISSVILYEREINIVDASSKMPLAKGVAYMNKTGDIIRIKVIKEK